jgi:hypothetical protein
LGNSSGNGSGSPTSSGNGSGSSTATGSAGNPTQLVDEWAACMRSHGDPNQADPVINSDGDIEITMTNVSQALSSETHDSSGPCGHYLTAASAALRGGQPAPQAPDQANLSTDQSALSSDQAKKTKDCAGKGASTAACSQDTQKVSQDQTTLTQARRLLATARSTAKTGDDQAQAKVGADQVKLRGNQAMLASLRATAVNPGTTYTWLPAAGEVIRQDQRVYSVSNEPVPLL